MQQEFQCPQYNCELLIYIGSVHDFKFFLSQAFMFMFSAYVFLLIYTFLLFFRGVTSCILSIIKNNEETHSEAVLWTNKRSIFKQKILFHQSSWQFFYYEPNKVRYISKINGGTIPLSRLTMVRKCEQALSPELEAALPGQTSFQNLSYCFDIVFPSFRTSYQALCQ